ncbi:hypothetical protein HRbin19_01118 [bacterium HR19]|nr:hypothetical protein HRbin19_01118 [bacterium HR19]
MKYIKKRKSIDTANSIKERNLSKEVLIRLLVFFIAIALSNSCIEIHAKFKINRDGTGYGKIVYVVNRGIYSAPDEQNIAINEDKLAESIAKREGVKVIKTGSSWENENTVRVWVEFEFKDISRLSDSFSKYYIEDLGNGKKEFRAYYKLRGELHKRELLKSMFKDLSSSLEVEFPGKVISTNGKKIGSNKVVWNIPAEEYVGRDVDLQFIAQFEVGKEGLIQKIKNKIKSIL